jgi:hypothetical protein
MMAWLIALLFIGLMVWALVREHDRMRGRTTEEFERDVARGQGLANNLMRAGGLGLEKVLTDEKRGAIEYVLDEERGMTKTGSKGDDKDRTSGS